MEAYKLYSRLDGKLTILELWGSSTKHPDSTFSFENVVGKTTGIWSLYQWIIQNAAQLYFRFHTYCLVDFANELINGAHGK